MFSQWQQLVNQKLQSSQSQQSATAQAQQPRFYDLTELGLISIKGPDSRRFLQGQITANIDQIHPSKAGLSAVCTPQGRMKSLFLLIACPQDEYLALMPRELIEPTLEGLSKFAVFYQTSLTEVTEDWAIYGLDHSNSGSQEEAHLSVQQAADQVNDTDKLIQVTWAGHRAIRLCSIEQAIGLWSDSATPAYDYQHWLAADIQAGIPRLYRSTIETFLPHNLNLPELGAVSFNKGCYTGQEVIARMHYKGKLKSHMRYLTAQLTTHPLQPPVAGSEIIADGQKMGEVICASQIENTWHLLALCKDTIESAAKIQCNMENAPILKLSQLPDQQKESL
jgi:hypothetical protein